MDNAGLSPTLRSALLSAGSENISVTMPMSKLGPLDLFAMDFEAGNLSEWEGSFFSSDDLKALKQHLRIGQGNF